MEYIELHFKIAPIQPASEILVAELSELGYESFVEEENGLKAYIASHLFDKKQIDALFVMQNQEFSIDYKWKKVAEENWNAKWESEYDSVLIDPALSVMHLQRQHQYQRWKDQYYQQRRS